MATSFEELRALREAEIVADGILLKSPIFNLQSPDV